MGKLSEARKLSEAMSRHPTAVGPVSASEIVAYINNRISYKPDWSIVASESDGIVVVDIAFMAYNSVGTIVDGRTGQIMFWDRRGSPLWREDPADVDTVPPKIRVTVREAIHPAACRNIDDVIYVMREILFKVEMHERDEWFKIDGVLYEDPHAQ